ncbi:AP-1 complex subunit sigma-1-like isoform X1 [Camellia sinensis]|uniref:AP-1 complex subunit sigma-1-like isoform X1 n=1 Tax=Camellia sinensis TaxID=4442 RepID=UPI001036C119|nr:AP-1 complex subunit sigma-1-like isoform X1 [Camellia sinensis]
MRNIHFVLLISRQGKVRLTKWYSPYTQKERTKGNTEGNWTKKYAVPKCPPILPSPLFGLPDKGGLFVQNPPFSWDYLSNPEVLRELSGLILTRGPKLCNFVEWRGFKVVYKRYASLYFCMCINQDDNELEILEIIHHFVEILDRYFGSVCELDLIFNFHKAYYILDEVLIAGELQESSKKTVHRLIDAQDSLVEAAKEQASSISNMIAQATK